MQEAVKRRSPVVFDIAAADTEERDGWSVVRQYTDEGKGPHIVDLSHLPRWDLQDKDLSRYTPAGLTVPGIPGDCIVSENLMLSRMNKTQSCIWHLGPGASGVSEEPAYTDIREGTACLAMVGNGVISVSEKVTRLDLADPGRKTPCLIQGPVARVPCQLVLLDNRTERQGFVFTCSRGYARDMIEVLLAAGREFGLRPAGENRMVGWNRLQES